jgi:hypothetical protein
MIVTSLERSTGAARLDSFASVTRVESVPELALAGKSEVETETTCVVTPAEGSSSPTTPPA